MSDLPKLSDLTPGVLERRLAAAGVSIAAVAAKREMFDACRRRLLAMGCPPDAPTLALAIPGRIEVLGKHTDYAGGRSLLAATEKGFCLLAARRPAGPLRIAPLGGEPIEIPVRPDLQPPLGHWSNYPMTVARRVARNFAGPFAGAHVAFASDLPPAAGMSSSSALVVAIFLVLSRLNDLPARDEYRRALRATWDLCGYLGCIENGQSFGTLTGDKGVGTFGGSEDHTAILCCKPGTLSQFHYCPVVFERDLPLPPDLTFVIADSGVVAEKTGAALQLYNRASQRAQEAAQAWRTATGGSEPNLEAIALAAPDAATRMRQILAGNGALLNRFNQFHAESREIIPAAGDALLRGDLAAFGELVRQSQAMAENLLGNQVPETAFLAKSAREAGAVAASAFGAGFGGAVWALTNQVNAQAFCERWTRLYHAQFPAQAQACRFIATRPGPGALDLTLT